MEHRQRWQGLSPRRVRVGKTAADRAGGQTQRNRGNQEARNAWLNGGGREAFPTHTLGGKGNSTNNPFKMMGGRGRVQI